MDAVTSETDDQTLVVYEADAMEDSIVSLQELVNAPAITLTVGPDQCQTTIQTTLFRGMSKGLHKLLNSPLALEGDMEVVDSILKTDDKVAFMQLLKAAYATIVNGKATRALSAEIVKTPAFRSPQTTLSKAPCPSCKRKSMQLAYTCVSCNPYISENDDDVLGLDTFFLVQFYQSVELSLAQIHTLIGTETTSPQMSIDSKYPISGEPYQLLHFARVYMLASKYKIMPVKIAALKNFYRRLKIVHTTFHDAEEAFMDEMIDALRFLSSSAGKTSPFGKIVPPEYVAEDNTGTSPADYRLAQTEKPDLLTTLMRYMLVRVDDLLAKQEFREIIAGNGALGLIVMEILRQGIDLSD